MTAVEGEEIHVEVVGRDSLGDHITAKAVVAVPETASRNTQEQA